MKLTVRLAGPDDVAAICTCAEEAYEKYVARIGRKPAPMVADFAALVEKEQVHVATSDNGVLLGYIVFYPVDGSMHLENVAVTSASQGLGVGRRLLGLCEQAAREAGCSSVDLYTNEKMTENLTLYPRLGYVETERRTEDGFNRVYFKKHL